jgi:glyoxylase-like metal-dependent hydrolase (beta-lactamase superfamily II)
VLETRPGVYFWQAPHPDWEPGDDWEELVTSYALDDGARLLVIDPLAAPAELDRLAAGRTVTIIVTSGWHRRDSDALAERLGAQLYVPAPDANHPEPGEGTIYTGGTQPVAGVRAFKGLEDSELVLWDEHHGAVIAGDTLIDRGNGLILPYDWALKRGDPGQIRASLLPLLELPVDVVLPTHGLPTDRAALQRALRAGDL